MSYLPPVGLEFDPGPHVYRYMGQEVPSVTQILKVTGAIRGFYRGTEARDRGIAIHEATELMDTIGVPVDAFQMDIRPWLVAWQEFTASTGVEIVSIECPVCHLRAGYAGTADRLINYNNRLAVLDIKTGSKAAWHRLQAAAYAEAIESTSGGEITTALVVRLAPKGFKVDLWSDVIPGAEPFLPCKQEWRQELAKYKERIDERHHPV
jgi:hypothetical protein